jgi:hypothetical protein
MLKEETAVFVWRCPNCPGVYSGESLLFLYTDGDHRYCRCGSRLIEGVAGGVERHYRLVLPKSLRGTLLHRQLEELLADEEDIEVAPGRDEDRHISLFSCPR